MENVQQKGYSDVLEQNFVIILLNSSEYLT